MSTVRIGIIGLGGMGSSHAGYLTKGEVPNCRLAAVADVAPARLEYAASRWGDDVRRFGTAEALLDSGEVDGVLIATPHYFHPPIAIAAMQRGIHVLSEKPAGVYTKQVREMNEVALQTGLVFGLMFNQRTRNAHIKMQELVASGEVGEIRRTSWIITDWFRTQFYYDSGGWRATWAGEGGGVLINQCPHNLDLWQWICGVPSRVRAFCGFGKHHAIEVEDDVTAFVEYPNGATGVFVTTTGDSPGTNRFEVSGDRGKLVLEGGKLTFWRTRGSIQQFIVESQQGFARPEEWRCEIPVGDRGGEHKSVTAAWVNAIAKGTPLVAPGTEGIKSLEISNAMHLSAWTDDWATIPVDEELYLKLLNERIAASQVAKAGGRVMDVEGTF
ncbi:MAG: Gfo/Idh/MocA family oxidoreductase [Fimbriimonadaceae bacterium]|nr:Gfo/Idh/MocA family oxidoreductase [Fimbriimonadaceae bacterium]